MLDPRKLHLLRELARRGTIAAVAEAVTFTPSAVSQQLSALEREAGVPLLERTGRTVTLTPAGQLLVEHAHAVLEQLERASAALASSYTFVNPLIAMLLGVAIAGERVSPFEWAAVAVVLAGVVLLMMRRR